MRRRTTQSRYATEVRDVFVYNMHKDVDKRTTNTWITVLVMVVVTKWHIRDATTAARLVDSS